MTTCDCADICDRVMEIMCLKCPHFPDTCMPDEETSFPNRSCNDRHADEANHKQMLICMDHMKDRLKGVFPNEDENCD